MVKGQIAHHDISHAKRLLLLPEKEIRKGFTSSSHKGEINRNTTAIRLISTLTKTFMGCFGSIDIRFDILFPHGTNHDKIIMDFSKIITK